MTTVKKIWQQFKSHPDIWFFYGFLITFTLSIRKVLFFYPINGQFNEYAGISLYLSDIFLILILITWGCSILCNNKYSLSSIKLPLTHNLKLVPRGTFIMLPLILVLWSFLSLIWTDNQFIALFRSIKLAEFYLLFLYIIHNVPRGTLLKRSAQVIIATGVIQSLLAAYQFILQHSIGLIWLRESVIGPNIPGVAKLIIDGHKIIRAYGLFPHPNILGGFLLFSIILTWSYHRLFHVEQSGYRRPIPKLKAILIIQIIGIILTFSKSAMLGLAITALYIAIKTIVPRGTISREWLCKMFHVEHCGRKLLISIGIILTLGYIFRPDINSLLFKSLNERLLYLNVSRGTILSHPVIGIGSGQFVLEMQKYATQILESWQYQPVHNVFLLIWSELGAIGLMLFIWWLWKLFHVEQKLFAPDVKCTIRDENGCEVFEPVMQQNVPRGTFLTNQKNLGIFQGALLGLVLIMLFDHYLWDIQQGQLIFWIVAAIIGGLSLNASIDNS